MIAVITRKAQLRGHPNSLYFEYDVWDSWEAMNGGVQPDQEAHVIQRNWTGRRIVTNGDGRLRTTGGLWIDPDSLLLETTKHEWEYEASSINMMPECRSLIERNLLSIATRNVAPKLARNIQYEDTQLGRLADLEVIAIGEQRPERPRGMTSAVLDLQVGASTDDAYELLVASATPSLTTTSILQDSGTGSFQRYIGAHRFTGATIQGTTIDVAYETHYATVSDDPSVDIHGQDEDDAATFTLTLNLLKNLALTAASVSYVATAIGTGAVQGPSIVSVIQELADRGSFADDGLAVHLRGQELTRTFFRTVSWDGDSAKALQLHIEFTAVGVTRRIFITG